MINASVVEIDILGGYQGGAEPWERTASFRIDAEGFHETHLLGRSGDRASVDVPQVAKALKSDFESASLLQLLDYVVELRTVLREMNGAARAK